MIDKKPGNSQLRLIIVFLAVLVIIILIGKYPLNKSNVVAPYSTSVMENNLGNSNIVLIKDRTGKDIKKIDLSEYINIEKKTYPQDVQLTQGEIERTIVDKATGRIFATVSLTGFPSQNGLPMQVLKIDINGKDNEIEYIPNSHQYFYNIDLILSGDGKYMVLPHTYHINSCKGEVGVFLISVDTKEIVKLDPPNGKHIPKDVDPEMSESISEGVEKPTWSSNFNNISFKRIFYDCGEKISPTETWQYNLEMKEYKLISTENE